MRPLTRPDELRQETEGITKVYRTTSDAMTRRVRLTEHALDRVRDRLAANGVRFDDRALARLDANAQRESSAAFLLFALPDHRGDVAGGRDRGSNGDTVWAIVRGGRVVTVMFRRSAQPQTPAALYVDTVYTLPMFAAWEVKA